MPSPNDPADCVCAHLRHAARALTAAYDDALRPSGLRSTQFTLLSALSVAKSAPVGALAAQTGTDRTTLTRNLQTMEASGWITIATGKEDRRQTIAALTPAGRKALAAALPLWRKAQAETLQALPRKSWEKLYRRLDTVEKHLGAQSSGANQAAS